jgi:hypothetical protein
MVIRGTAPAPTETERLSGVDFASREQADKLGRWPEWAIGRLRSTVARKGSSYGLGVGATGSGYPWAHPAAHHPGGASLAMSYSGFEALTEVAATC